MGDPDGFVVWRFLVILVLYAILFTLARLVKWAFLRWRASRVG